MMMMMMMMMIEENFDRKTKISSQEEILIKWKEHFKNLLGNPPEITENLTKNYKLPTRHQISSLPRNKFMQY